jgi:hypothetical protein
MALESKSFLSSIKQALLTVCDRIDAYEKSKPNQLNEEWFFVSIRNNSVYINDKEIISPKAELQFAIFMAFIKQYVDNFCSNSNGSLKIDDILKTIENDKEISDAENQIRRNINRIKTKIRQTLYTKEIILSSNNKGY